MCTPTTSCPASTARAAATAESTPPLSAANTFTPILPRVPPRAPAPRPRARRPVPRQYLNLLLCVRAKTAAPRAPHSRPIPSPAGRGRAAELQPDTGNQQRPEFPLSQVGRAANRPHTPELGRAHV